MKSMVQVLMRNDSLKYFDLTNCGIRAEGVQQLTNLAEDHACLREVILTDNPLSDADLVELKTVLDEK